MKKCSMCGILKDESLFNKKRKSFQDWCKECNKIYQREHYKNNKEDYIEKAARTKLKYRLEFNDYMSTQSCVDCGNDNPVVLEFDHLHNKEFTIGNKVGYRRLSSLIKEIEKCEVVCANCHKIRTAKRSGWTKYKE